MADCISWFASLGLPDRPMMIVASAWTIGWAAAGLVIGFLLGGLAVHFVIGRRVDETADAQQGQQRMLDLLGELGAWTDEYSGNVFQYHQQLGQSIAAVRTLNAAASDEDRMDGKQLIGLLEEIVEKGNQVQLRLDHAEAELDRKTEQIKSYLVQARTDEMTGLLNRRAFDESLEEKFAAFREGGSTFSVALIDVDHFKSINDGHGHLAGDGVLQRLAKWMREWLDSPAILARYGGDEFAVLSAEPAPPLARKLDAIRRSIGESGFQIDGDPSPVTLSVGVAQSSDDATSLAIVRRADEALYRAKELGRNRTVFDSGRGATLIESPNLASHPRDEN